MSTESSCVTRVTKDFRKYHYSTDKNSIYVKSQESADLQNQGNLQQLDINVQSLDRINISQPKILSKVLLLAVYQRKLGRVPHLIPFFLFYLFYCEIIFRFAMFCTDPKFIYSQIDFISWKLILGPIMFRFMWIIPYS